MTRYNGFGIKERKAKVSAMIVGITEEYAWYGVWGKLMWYGRGGV